MSSLKRGSSFTVVSAKKKTRRNSRLSVRFNGNPRGLRSSTAFVQRAVWYESNFTSDHNFGFGFSPTYLWVNGTSTTAIEGVADMTAMFDSCRIRFVDCIILSSGTMHDTGIDSVGTGIRNIPYVWHAFDANDSASTTQSSLMQMQGVKIDDVSRPIRRRIYPKMATSSGLEYPLSVWNQTGVDTNPWFGLKVYADTIVSQTYLSLRYNFIITYECKGCK